MRTAYIIYDRGTPAFVRTFLRELLRDSFSVQESDTGEPPVFKKEDFLVFVPGNWWENPEGELLCRILTHVTGGGRMLALGEGLWKVDSPELNLLYGARFSRKLPYSQISLKASGISSGEEWGNREIWDTPLIFEPSAFGRPEVLISMEYGGAEYPLIWHRDWFQGHVYCAAVGSSLPAWEAWMPVLRRMIPAAAEGE